MSALSAKDPRELLPIWGVAEPTVMSTATARTRGNICVRDGDDGTVRFRDVIASLKALWKTFNVRYLSLESHITENSVIECFD